MTPRGKGVAIVSVVQRLGTEEPRVFDWFWQAPGKNMAGGLGLGLKSLVELHGGSVAARSDGPGTGT